MTAEASPPPDLPKAPDPQPQDEVFHPETERLIRECMEDYPLLTREETVAILRAFGGI